MAGKMKLSEIAAAVGVPVCQITPRAIIEAKSKGLITGNQEQRLLVELKEADGIWQTTAPGIACAKSL